MEAMEIQDKAPGHTPFWVPPIGELWMQLLASPGKTKDPEAMIGNAFEGPLRALGVDPVVMSESGRFGHYVLAMLPALLTLAEERARQQRREALVRRDEEEMKRLEETEEEN